MQYHFKNFIWYEFVRAFDRIRVIDLIAFIPTFCIYFFLTNLSIYFPASKSFPSFFVQIFLLPLPFLIGLFPLALFLPLIVDIPLVYLHQILQACIFSIIYHTDFFFPFCPILIHLYHFSKSRFCHYFLTIPLFLYSFGSFSQPSTFRNLYLFLDCIIYIDIYIYIILYFILYQTSPRTADYNKNPLLILFLSVSLLFFLVHLISQFHLFSCLLHKIPTSACSLLFCS